MQRSARRLHGTAVAANCLHPGFVATRFGDQSGGVISHLVGLAKLFAISSEKGTETIIYLASSAAVAETTRVYFYKGRPITPSHAARDDRAALLLWERSGSWQASRFRSFRWPSPAFRKAVMDCAAHRLMSQRTSVRTALIRSPVVIGK
jgi:hypothetical protein